MLSLEIKKLTPQDLPQFLELIRVFEEVFEMENFRMPAAHYLQKLLAREDFMVFVALERNRVIGGLTAFTLQQYYTEQPLAYIFDLAVLAAFQRQGIGRKLMTAITEHCRELGMSEVFVQADEPDDYALEFYRNTGGLPEKVVHFTYPLTDK